MLINCPRCGFSQPNDQYCAQCGIDMQNFKPKEEPFLNKLFSNWIFLILLLILIAGFIFKFIYNKPAPQKLVQKIFHSQGVTESIRGQKKSLNEEMQNENNNQNNPQNESLKSAPPVDSSAAVTAKTNSDNKDFNSQTVVVKLIFAEVSTENINRWIADSSSLGLYQNFNDYSLGVLPDYKKRNEPITILKNSDLKINIGSTNTNLSGILNEEGNQVLGFTSSIEIRSLDNDIVMGALNIVKTSRSSSDNYNSEFELPKGSAFFILGSLKTENFLAERAKLLMPPFQIFKSPDFMTHKTEFVIVLQPDYK